MKTYSSTPDEGEEAEIIPCPLCEEEKFRPQWDCGDFRFVRCSRCGTIYQNPQILPRHALSRYDGEYCHYEEENEETFLSLMKLGLEDAGFDKWEETLKAEGPVLDVGCATGALIRWLSGRGWRAEGLEICSASAERARSGGQTVHQVPLEEAGLTGETYSFIHASHVIEHLNDPASFVKEIFRLLIPGGAFLCVTPNTRSFQALLKGAGWRSAIADHLVLFSAPRLKNLLRDGGFRVGPWKTWGGAPAGSLPPLLKKGMDRAAKWGNWGDVVMILAVKPIKGTDRSLIL